MLKYAKSQPINFHTLAVRNTCVQEAGLVREELTRVQGLLQKYEKDEGGGAAGGRGQDSERVMR